MPVLSRSAVAKSSVLALAGNPNVGKSTLFNALTGAHQKVANYPGVTVEKKSGRFITPKGAIFEVLDLPGTYSLTPHSADEDIATRTMLGQLPGQDGPPQVIAVVAEATSLERGLVLLRQIQHIHPYVVLIVNMLDELATHKLEINLIKLSQLLGVPVFGTTATKNQGIKEFGDFLDKNPSGSPLNKPRRPSPKIPPPFMMKPIKLLSRSSRKKICAPNPP